MFLHNKRKEKWNYLDREDVKNRNLLKNGKRKRSQTRDPIQIHGVLRLGKSPRGIFTSRSLINVPDYISSLGASRETKIIVDLSY